MHRVRACVVIAGAGVGGAIAACQLVDPGSAIDGDYGVDGGAMDGGAMDAAVASGTGVRCYVDGSDDQPIYDFCPSDQSCCYAGDYLGTGACTSAPCSNISLSCSDQAQCSPGQLCCAQAGLMGGYLVLQSSTCVDACAGSQALVLCNPGQSGVCPSSTSCQSNGSGNRPLGYDSCKP